MERGKMLIKFSTCRGEGGKNGEGRVAIISDTCLGEGKWREALSSVTHQ